MKGRMPILLGLILLVVLGLLFGLGRLPGDIHVRGKHFSFYFPVVTCLLLSAVVSLAIWLFRR